MPRIVRFYEKGGPEVLKVEEVEVAPPGPDEVAVAIKAIGINRAESMFRSGPYVEDPVFPARLGYEGAGVVTAVGSGVSGFAPGDSVSVIPPLSITRWGSYGETATFPAEVVVKHPASLSWVQAAAIWMQYVTAYGALIEIADLRKGEFVLIDDALEQAEKYLLVLDEHLKDRPFILGESLSFVDFAIASAEPYRDRMPIDFDRFANLQRHYDFVAELPAWQKALGSAPVAVAA
jgi:hypothetical protein